MVDVLLATYNGECYLREQIESILNQTHDKWRLIIRDDGSSDSTKEIIEEYANVYPQKIEVITDSFGNMGVVRNFKELLKHSEGQYVMFCDQDDIWDCNKIKEELAVMKKTEKENSSLPILVFSDLRGIDYKGDIIFDSFNKKNGFYLEKIIFSRLLFKNTVTGCTMIINKLLRQYLLDMPDDIKVHDHWAVLVCLVNNGVVKYIDKATVSYRQHSKNVIGDKSLSKRDIFKKIVDVSTYNERKKQTVNYYKKVEHQISTLNRLYIGRMDADTRKLMEVLNNIWTQSPIKRIVYLYKYKCLQKGIYVNILLIMYYFKWGKGHNIKDF